MDAAAEQQVAQAYDRTIAAAESLKLDDLFADLMENNQGALIANGRLLLTRDAVTQRTQEFGVRIALGATPGDVLRQVIRQGLVLAASGIAVGLALALGVTHLLASFLYGVSPFDPLTFAGVPLLLALVTLLACYLPARRATRVNPVEALCAE